MTPRDSMRIAPPVPSDSFHLEIDGISGGSFVRCSGLGAAVSVFEYAEGGLDGVRRFRGDAYFPNLVLERGIVPEGYALGARGLFEWFSRGDRRDGAILLLSADGREVERWAFTRGWPCRWEGPLLDASRPAAALELLEITHEGLQWIAR